MLTLQQQMFPFARVARMVDSLLTVKDWAPKLLEELAKALDFDDIKLATLLALQPHVQRLAAEVRTAFLCLRRARSSYDDGVGREGRSKKGAAGGKRAGAAEADHCQGRQRAHGTV